MSLILGAMAGAGEGLGRWAEQGIKHDQDVDLENLRNENAYNKAIAMEQWKRQASLEDMPKIAQANLDAQKAARLDQVTTLDSATAPLMDTARLAKINRGRTGLSPLSSIADASPDDLSKFALTADEKGAVRTEAISGAGYLNPAAEVSDAAKMRHDVFRQVYENAREEGRNARAEGRDAQSERNSIRRMDGLAAMIAARWGGDGDKEASLKSVVGMIREERLAVSQEQNNLTKLMHEELRATDGDQKQITTIKAAYEPRIAALSNKREKLDYDFERVRTKVLGERAPAGGGLISSSINSEAGSFNSGLADTPFGALGKVSSSAPTAPASFKSLWRQ